MDEYFHPTVYIGCETMLVKGAYERTTYVHNSLELVYMADKKFSYIFQVNIGTTLLFLHRTTLILSYSRVYNNDYIRHYAI